MSERMGGYRNMDGSGKYNETANNSAYRPQGHGALNAQSPMSYDYRQARGRSSCPESSPPPRMQDPRFGREMDQDSKHLPESTPPPRMQDPRFAREMDQDTKYRIPKIRESTPVMNEINQVRCNISSPTGKGYSAMNQAIYNVRSNPDVSQYQKYDGKKRDDPRESDYPVFNRRLRFKCTNPYPGEVPMVLEGWPEKDDDMIKVDPILVNPKWNFWNLPSKSKVLLVSNLNSRLTNHLALFNLFGLYGDVLKVKLFKNDEMELRNIAMIEFRSATFAMLARNMLDQESIVGQTLVVSFSRYERILSEEELGIESSGKWIIRSFEDQGYMSYRRFATEGRMRSNLRVCIVKPTVTLAAFNFFPETTAGKVIEVIKRNGFQVVDVLALQLQGRSLEYEEFELENCDKRRKILIEFADTSSSLMAMALLTGDPDLGEIIFYFNMKNISEEKSMNESNNGSYKILEYNEEFQS